MATQHLHYRTIRPQRIPKSTVKQQRLDLEFHPPRMPHLQGQTLAATALPLVQWGQVLLLSSLLG